MHSKCGCFLSSVCVSCWFWCAFLYTRARERWPPMTGSNSRHPDRVCPRLQVVGRQQHARNTTTTSRRSFAWSFFVMAHVAWGFFVMAHACQRLAAVRPFHLCAACCGSTSHRVFHIVKAVYAVEVGRAARGACPSCVRDAIAILLDVGLYIYSCGCFVRSSRTGPRDGAHPNQRLCQPDTIEEWLSCIWMRLSSPHEVSSHHHPVRANRKRAPWRVLHSIPRDTNIMKHAGITRGNAGTRQTHGITHPQRYADVPTSSRP